MPIFVITFKVHEKALGTTDYRGQFIVGEVGEKNKIDKAFISKLFKEFIREINFYIESKRENKKP